MLGHVFHQEKGHHAGDKSAAVLKIVDTSSMLNALDFSIKERSGDCIECLVQVGLLTLPFLSIALTGHISWHTKQSSGQPHSSFSGQDKLGSGAVVTIPPSINLGPYMEWKSRPFFPIFPNPVASAILTNEILPKKSPGPLNSTGNQLKTGVAISLWLSMITAAWDEITSIWW